MALLYCETESELHYHLGSNVSERQLSAATGLLLRSVWLLYPVTVRPGSILLEVCVRACVSVCVCVRVCVSAKASHMY